MPHRWHGKSADRSLGRTSRAVRERGIDLLTRTAAAGLTVLALGSAAAMAHDPHECPSQFPDEPAIPGHVEQADISGGSYRFEEIFDRGARLFSAQFNTCDGRGRPAATGIGAKRDPADQPDFTRTSAPDANSCAGCHNAPRAGGAGDFVANVFVLAQALNPVTESVSPEFSNERNTLGMFGAGAIEMLAREMTAELQAQAADPANWGGATELVSKGVAFDVVIDRAGKVVESKGIDTDLVVKPFHQSGVVASIREFTVKAMNHHHGMQPEERFAGDFDDDGVAHELSIGDITATTLFQAALGVPGRMLPADPAERDEVARGEAIFSEIGCAACHVPEMRLESRIYVEPNPLNPPGAFADPGQSYAFDLTRDGERPRLERAPGGGAIVRAYTDLKRHNLCDDAGTPGAIRFFCNERLAQGRPDQEGKPGAEFFITRKLWDVGNSGPWGHRGDLTTITEAILAHGGEARAARDAFAGCLPEDQRAVVRFLKTLRVLPPGSPPVMIVGCDKPVCGDAPAGTATFAQGSHEP